jgi:hypothetical protein
LRHLSAAQFTKWEMTKDSIGQDIGNGILQRAIFPHPRAKCTIWGTKMFTTKHSIGTLYLALNGATSRDLADNLARRGIKAATIAATLGLWEGQQETAYIVTIIGETASPAHIANDPYAPELPRVLMPSDPTAFESRIRTLAENLANDYRQDCVAFTIAPCLFELTTGQATYKRNG